jgi:hypothetical protein
MARGDDIRLQAKEYIERAVREGVSANKTLDILKSYGLGYQRKEFLANYAQAAGRPQKVVGNANIPDKFVPPDRTIEKRDEILKTQYVYNFKVRMKDTDTGEALKWRFSIGSDDKITLGDAKAKLLEALEARSDYYHKEVGSLSYEDTWERKEES